MSIRFYSIHRSYADGTHNPMPSAALMIEGSRVVRWIDDMNDVDGLALSYAEAFARFGLETDRTEAVAIDGEAFDTHADQWRIDRPPVVDIPGF